MDSGAGQCMCSCSEAFHSLRPCAVMVVGVAGSMPVHGIGTACFTIIIDGKTFILRNNNCLFCHGMARHSYYEIIIVCFAMGRIVITLPACPRSFALGRAR